MSLAGSSVPWATPMNAPMPIFFIWALSIISIRRPWFVATFWAASAIRDGVMWLAGSLTMLRAVMDAWAMVQPSLTPTSMDLARSLSNSTTVSFSNSFVDSPLFVR